MASTLVALQTVTVGAGGTATVSFTNIPQTYNDLVVKVSSRSDATGSAWRNFTIAFNGTAYNTNWLVRGLYGTGSAAGSDSQQVSIGTYSTSDSATANTFSNVDIYIPNYASNNYKSYLGDSVTENNATSALIYSVAGLWSNTDPITSMTIGNESTALFKQYSTFTLYGVYKSPLETTPEAPTIGTATAASTGANVAFTPSGTGAPASTYIATSSPGGITATGASSPILVTGLTSGTAYTFTVRGQNPGGTGAASAASNSVTPYDGYESIATVVVGSGGSSTITFSSIPQTFTHLQLRCFNNSGNGNMQFNGDTGTNYSRHYIWGNGTTATSGASTSATSMGIIDYASTANIFNANIADILDYTNTNKNKTVRVLSGVDTNGAGSVLLYSGLWRSTAAITSITLTGGTAAQYSVFELYGIR